MAQRFSVCAGLWVCTALLLLGPRGAVAQSSGDRAKGEAALRQAAADYVKAIEHGDGKAIADFWTADGTYTDQSGRTANIHDLFAKGDNQARAAGARPVAANSKLRFLTDDVALEDGAWNIPGVDGSAPAIGHYTATWVRTGGRWKLDSVRETQTTPAANADQLASLNVFEGEWAGEANKIAIHVSAKWDANRKFLRRQITMTAGKSTLAGTQFVGWDPLAQQIRSWTFNDDGSYSDGAWSLQDNKWLVVSTRVLPDGSTSEAVQVYKVPDKSTIVWKLILGSIDGQPTDDVEVVLKHSAGTK
jgi:ketosteroid isomerase-like protein